MDKYLGYHPLKKENFSLNELSYSELKQLSLDKKLTTGNHYLITDFITQFTMGNSWFGGNIYSGSTQGQSLGLDQQIEPLIVIAASESQLQTRAYSTVYPKHIIEYDPKWDWVENSAVLHPTGQITKRIDHDLNIDCDFDFVGYRIVRWALTADVYNPATTYSRKQTTRLGDGLYISLVDNNTGNDPSLTDGQYWMMFRPSGEDTSGWHRDYISWHNDTDPYMLPFTYGFKVDTSRHKVFNTISFKDDLTLRTGIGPNGIGVQNIRIVHPGNMILLDNASSYTGWISFGDTCWNNTIVSNSDLFGFDFLSANASGNYILGLVYRVSALKHFSINYNYLEGVSFSRFISQVLSSQEFDQNIGIRKGVSRSNFSPRLLNASILSGSSNLFYSIGQLHASNVDLTKCNILGTINNCDRITLYNSTLDNGVTIKSSTIISEGYFVDGNYSNPDNHFKANIENSRLIDLTGCRIEGSLNGVRAYRWQNVFIPLNVTLIDVVFQIPLWKGLNIWSGDTLSLKQVSINKRFVDNPSSPTIEKLWYSQIDQNGQETFIELK